MFLPSQLPKGARSKESLEEQQETHEMGGKRKKKAADRDEMLGPNSPMAAYRPSTSAGPAPGFVARSWARISGRRRRHKRRMTAEAAFERREQRFSTTLTTADAHPYGNDQTGQDRLSWPTLPAAGNGNSGTGNLAALAHLEEDMVMEGRRKRHFIGRGMDRIRRSIRRSLHKGSSQSGQVLTHSAQDGQPSSSSGGPSGGTIISSGISKAYCHSDELAVRSAVCSFPVKYLGACEVFESRGMTVCESALQHLRTRKRTIKALLYVSGDGIRVVDQENNRGLIVDQTIEKVSFCSPDRHNDKGFAYICRDGATRRWMCHGFHAIKDSGERLSHAVGCAFTVCLEKKRKRDAETTAYKNAQSLANSLNDQQQNPLGQIQEEYHNDAFSRTNQGYRSFRPLSISERRADPQKAILVEQPRPISIVESPRVAQTAAILAAKSRPSANPTLFERMGSLRAPTTNEAPIPGPKPQFNRFNSLQHGTANRNSLPRISLYNEPIWEGEDDGHEENAILGNGHSLTTSSHESHFYRTLPYSLPSFGQSINQCSLSNVIQPTTPEEVGKQQNIRPLQLDNPSPPADPFISTKERENGPKARAEGWLEQTFQCAASISSTMPRSATMNLPSKQQQNWAQFPQSQSFVQDWTDGISNCAKPSNPPEQPPPPLPSWLTSPGSFNAKQSSSSESMPIPILPTPKDKKPLPSQNQSEKSDQQQTLANKNHLRKASGNRRIEYQLLQETDVSLSPPKNDSSMQNRMIGGTQCTAIAEDPFDVHWSQQVLEETAKQRQNGGHQLKTGAETESSGQQANPFTWEMGSASVNV